MKEFRGSYLGISPTDESAIATGEFSMVVGVSLVTLRHAVKPGVVAKADIHLYDIQPMSEEEMFPHGVPEGAVGKYKGFITNGGVQFLFTVNPSGDEFDIFVRRGEMCDLLGPTMLWNRRRTRKIFSLKAMLFLANLRFKGNVPRLSRWKWMPL